MRQVLLLDKLGEGRGLELGPAGDGGIDAIVLQLRRAECLRRGTPIDIETDTVVRGTFSRPFLAVAR